MCGNRPKDEDADNRASPIARADVDADRGGGGRRAAGGGLQREAERLRRRQEGRHRLHRRRARPAAPGCRTAWPPRCGPACAPTPPSAATTTTTASGSRPSSSAATGTRRSWPQPDPLRPRRHADRDPRLADRHPELAPGDPAGARRLRRRRRHRPRVLRAWPTARGGSTAGPARPSSARPPIHNGLLDWDVPVPADYDGDLKADLAVFHPTDHSFHILQSKTGTERVVRFPNDAALDAGAGRLHGDGISRPGGRPTSSGTDLVAHPGHADADLHLHLGDLDTQRNSYPGRGRLRRRQEGRPGGLRPLDPPGPGPRRWGRDDRRHVAVERRATCRRSPSPAWSTSCGSPPTASASAGELPAGLDRRGTTGRSARLSPASDYTGDRKADPVYLQWPGGTWSQLGVADPLFTGQTADNPAPGRLRRRRPLGACRGAGHLVDLEPTWRSRHRLRPADGHRADAEGLVLEGQRPRPVVAVPVPGDYDGDHRTDPAYYDYVDGTWWISGRPSPTSSASPRSTTAR